LRVIHDIIGESVIISLYSGAGKLVYIESAAGVVDGAGMILIPSHNLSSGLYFVSMNVDNKVYGKKMLINKVSIQ
jgi:hypothetical protein